jgi:protein phosphatase 2C
MERFHGLLAEEMENVFGAGDSLLVEFNDECNKKWDEVMKATFLKMDKEVGGVCPNGFRDEDDMMDTGCSCCVDAIAPENVGTTAVVAIIGTNQIIVANCGDSRAVLARENSAIPMSRDHKV